MNDIVLSSLLNLFSLSSHETGLDKEKSIELITEYLKYSFGIRDVAPYVELYATLREYCDESTSLNATDVIAAVCDKLRGVISKSEQAALLLRIMEFCSVNENGFNPNHNIFNLIKQAFEIEDSLFESLKAFIQSKEDSRVKIISLGTAGKLKVLFEKEYNKLFFAYDGNETITMNDVAVISGHFQIWRQSGVLNGRGFSPYYYSSIIAMYEDDQSAKTAVDFCGRDIDFRFIPGGEIGMHNLSFSLHSGQLVAIMGGSGVGKSTLLSLLNGSLFPQKGTVTINGHGINEPEAKALIGFVPQDDLLIEELTVYQNLWYTAKLCFDKMSDEEIDLRVTKMLAQLGLDAQRDLKVGSPINKYISGGQRKRLNIALELIREPAILFLDEPTSGLSSTDTEKVINLLKELTGRGKLIIANIHQPSSDVYQLFDRLWVLDVGGYPVYDGNPIEAVSYFKQAAHYADAEVSACPTCGNVNPEIILNIIDERALDTSGNVTDRRKIQPKEWHQMYLDSRQKMDAPVVAKVPETDQKRPNKLTQFMIFLRRNISTKLTNLQYILVTLLEAPILAVISAYLTKFVPESGTYTVMDNKNFASYLFMAIIVSIFLGMIGSAEEIIKDRALMKRERFLRLSHGSYIWSKIVYMAAVSLVQTFLFIIVGNAIVGLHGMLFTWWMILFVASFLSGLIGLLLSQFMNSVVAIYITIPLLLIPQILLCGLVVNFDDLNHKSETGNVPVIGDLIPSRWSYEALAVATFANNAYEKQFYDQDREKYSTMFMRNAFLYELESQVETRRDEMEDSTKVEDPIHLQIIHTELPYIAEIAYMDPYEGDDSYESLIEYIDQAKELLGDRSNRTTLALDRQVTNYIKEFGQDQLLDLKRSNYNSKLEDLVLNRETKDMYLIRGTHILPKCGYVFLTPRSRNGRAPFYSGVKVLGYYEIDTLWFNTVVQLIMSLLLIVCLLTDFPGRFVRHQKE